MVAYLKLVAKLGNPCIDKTCLVLECRDEITYHLPGLCGYPISIQLFSYHSLKTCTWDKRSHNWIYDKTR